VLAVLDGRNPRAVYDGYGACPLTVERGKVVLAEFGYGGKLLPTVPWDPTKPSRAAWLLKTKVLPRVYWDLMLRGREWLARPGRLVAPAAAPVSLPLWELRRDRHLTTSATRPQRCPASVSAENG
jgi:sulfide:quinone oxidoreductase